ncbi:hypothetical protein [Pseudomonas sp. TWP3-2]|uniref:hypothetical protein n=1 Tax=Pseudomonas sp. TWP3-2 TaxID=2804574 RepID=UPI003CED860C
MANTAVKPKGQAHDTDLLMASNVSSFKQWLITQGIAVTEPDRSNAARGVHYWVEVPGSKPVSVQECFGRKQRYAQTHFRLRQLLSSYLASPVATAIKDIVRPQTPGQLQMVVSGKIQSKATAANAEVPAVLQAVARDPGQYLLSEADIAQALAIASPIPVDAQVQNVFGVRVAGDHRKGMTVAAHMKVCDTPGGRRLVEVVEYPIHAERGDLKAQAEALFKRAHALPNATILVDVLGDGLVFFKHLQAFASPTVARYGLTMGQTLPKGGNGMRFVNRRAQCTVLATYAIQRGTLKLVLPSDSGLSDPLTLLGSRLPYSFDELGRYKIAKPSDIGTDHLPTADLFEAISLAFHSVELPVSVEKPVEACASPSTAPKAPAKVMDQYLTDLRDDFAISCPLVKDVEESMAAFANRRWVYAQAMIDARPA